MKLIINKGGAGTTIQDLGRFGCQDMGIPVSGAMDMEAYKQANELVGNAPDTPALEMTLSGPTMRIEGEGLIALCGAIFTLIINGKSRNLCEGHQVHDGDEVKIGNARKGARGYLAAAGHWQIPRWQNSCSTVPFLEASPMLPPKIQPGTAILITNCRVLPLRSAEPLPLPGPVQKIRLIRGPEYHLMADKSINALKSNSFQVHIHSNRMGVRLTDPLPINGMLPTMISSPVKPGVLQMTGDGHLIILMSDAQTTGGYARIGVIHPDDYRMVAQMVPGSGLHFEVI